MFCTNCGSHNQDGARFCENCGAALQASGAVAAPQAATPAKRRAAKPQDPYQPQIAQLKLQIKQLKLDLKRINTEMATIRSGYNQSSSFVPGGGLKRLYKDTEDMRLWGPQKKKQELQQEILVLEQQLLGLQQQQAQWAAQFK